ncbi:major facilitator superfamily domain-containing protein [Chaetomidium leptoderma]|uniref:Major facilitator superfamily domain-containing protein n=1 Tax=Chaetomidium leptoderma TaxID=669021 RepID=A0AAN6VRI6_9PEZI|nr:major facilitator superfamily domain-containing protein [Chaetomidium leptoderma]
MKPQQAQNEKGPPSSSSTDSEGAPAGLNQGDAGAVVVGEPLDMEESSPSPDGPGPAATARSNLRLSAILLALCLVVFLGALDQTIVSTAAVSITADLRDASGYMWIGAVYLLANASASPIWAKCSDIWGRKPAILTCIAGFAGASTMAGFSRTMAMLIAARALQGACAGGMMQLVNITISDLFSMRRRALYISAMGSVWILAGTSGPLIGGALSQYASWRWCFWINPPVCAVAFVIVLLFLDVHNPRTRMRDGLLAIDWAGTVSMLAVTLLLLIGLDLGGVVYPWDSPKVICLIVIGTLMIGVFVYSEKRLARYPLLLLSVFQGWSNVAIVVVALAHSMASFGAEYYLPLYFQSVKQASPLQSGLYILPMIITVAILDILSGVFMHRVGRYRELIWVGTVFLTLGTGLLILFGPNTNLGTIIGFQVIFGFGMALPLNTVSLAIQNSVRQQADTATAISTLNFIRNMGTSLAAVLGGVVFQNSMASRSPVLAASGLNQTQLDAFSGYAAAANVELIRTIGDAGQRGTVEDAYSWSIGNMFIMYTAIAGVGMFASVLIKHRDMSKEHTETKTGIENMAKRGAGETTD